MTFKNAEKCGFKFKGRVKLEGGLIRRKYGMYGFFRHICFLHRCNHKVIKSVKWVYMDFFRHFLHSLTLNLWHKNIKNIYWLANVCRYLRALNISSSKIMLQTKVASYHFSKFRQRHKLPTYIKSQNVFSFNHIFKLRYFSFQNYIHIQDTSVRIYILSYI